MEEIEKDVKSRGNLVLFLLSIEQIFSATKSMRLIKLI